MRNRQTLKPLLLSLMLILLIALISKQRFQVMPPLTEQNTISGFSATRAYQRLQTVLGDQQSHAIDSPGARIIEQNIRQQLSQMGYQPEVQQTKVCRDNNIGMGRCAQVRNIIVTIPGEQAAGILLSAHYDSVNAGPGASDAGIAVASLLEIAQLQSQQSKPRYTIILLFNEGEEVGLLGAKAFMEQHPMAKTIKLALNIDARGTTGKSVMYEAADNSGYLVDLYLNSTPSPLSSSLFYEVYRFLPNDTDMTIFKQHGLPGLNFANAERLPHYHTPLDNLANFDQGSLQHHGDNVWGVVKQLQQSEQLVGSHYDLTFTDVLGWFTLSWQRDNSLWIAIGLSLLFVVISSKLIALQQLAKTTIFRSFFGFFGLVIVLAITAAASQYIATWFAGNPAPWWANVLPMALAIGFIGLAVGLPFCRWIAKGRQPIALLVGVTLSFALLSIATGAFMAGISYLFILPLSTGVILLAIALLIQARLVNYLLILLPIVAGLLFLPLIMVLEIMLSYQLSGIMGIIYGWLLATLLPLMAFVNPNHDNSHYHNISYSDGQPATLSVAKIAASTALIGIGCLIWTSQQPPYTAAMPQGINLIYKLDQHQQGSLLVGLERNQLPEPLKLALGEINITSPLPWSQRRYQTANAQPQAVNVTQISSEVSSEASLGSETDKPLDKTLNKTLNKTLRHMRLKLSSKADQLLTMALYFPQDSGLVSIQYGDIVVNYADETAGHDGFYSFNCYGIHCAVLELRVSFNQPKPVSVYLNTIYSQLPAEYQPLMALRGDTAVPYQQGDLTLVVNEFQL